ncbi:MAG: hypothetical protein WBA93_12675 [Microcoleaceae cyanobacterium]
MIVYSSSYAVSHYGIGYLGVEVNGYGPITFYSPTTIRGISIIFILRSE